MSATGASITYAVGRLFIAQFEAGETVFGLDPVAAPSAAIEELPPPAAEAPAPVLLPPPAEPPPPQLPAPHESGGGAASGAPDDLTIVIGIGPKIAKLLATKGITTYAELAATTVASLQTILHEAGPSYSYHDPATWPEQAKLASEGKFDQLKVVAARDATSIPGKGS